MTDSARILIDAVSRLSRVQREVGTELARRLDCPRAALGLLWLLDKCGELAITDIAHHLRVDMSVASRQTKALVEAGYAERHRPSDPGTDHRVKTVRLTTEGQDFVRLTRRRLDQLMTEVFTGWTPEELRQAAGQINRITDTIAAASGLGDERTHTPAPEPDIPTAARTPRPAVALATAI